MVRIPYNRVWRPDIILYNKYVRRLLFTRCS